MCQIENLPRWKLARWWWRWVVWLSGKRCTILHKLWNINISDILKGATLALNSCQPASFPCPGCPFGAVGQDQRGRGEIQPTFFLKTKNIVEHRLILQARLEQENTNPITFEWLVRIYFMKSSSPKSFFPPGAKQYIELSDQVVPLWSTLVWQVLLQVSPYCLQWQKEKHFIFLVLAGIETIIWCGRVW